MSIITSFSFLVDIDMDSSFPPGHSGLEKTSIHSIGDAS